MMKFALPVMIASGVATVALASTPDAAPKQVGQTLYTQRCQACHGAIAGRTTPMAPPLAGVVGRKAAATTFAYSPALKRSNLVWTKAELNEYLANPSRKVPGGRMVVSVADPAQRNALIAYLATTR
jgi:cytochrome c